MNILGTMSKGRITESTKKSETLIRILQETESNTTLISPFSGNCVVLAMEQHLPKNDKKPLSEMLVSSFFPAYFSKLQISGTYGAIFYGYFLPRMCFKNNSIRFCSSQGKLSTIRMEYHGFYCRRFRVGSIQSSDCKNNWVDSFQG